MEYSSAAAGEFEYVAPIPGTSKTASSRRFDMDKLRPFEAMFVDNKEYTQFVRGGWKYAFVLICLKTQAKFKVDIQTKVDNGKAFTKIVALNGIHKLPYLCTVYSDGCGSMAHVMETAILKWELITNISLHTIPNSMTQKKLWIACGLWQEYTWHILELQQVYLHWQLGMLCMWT